MQDVELLRRDLEKFRRIKSGELDFAPIEKWMLKKLGVEKLPLKGGSHVYYRHPAIEDENEYGHFQVSLAHGRAKKIIYRKVFLEYLYPRLVTIINYVEKEQTG